MIKILKDKKANSSQYFEIAKLKLPKSKRSEGVFGMSFGMIFSIILIVVFMVVAFLGIRSFLNFQKTAQLKIFADDLQRDIDEAWNAGESMTIYKGNLPIGVQYVCFINWKNSTMNANTFEANIYREIQLGGISASENFYFYSPGKDFAIKSKQMKHIDLSSKNPICIRAIDGKASVKITKTFDNPLVVVSE